MAPVESTPKTNASKAEKTVNKKRNREEEPQGAADDTSQPVEKKSRIEILELMVKQCEDELKKAQEKLTDAKKRLTENIKQDEKKDMTTEQRAIMEKLLELTGETYFNYEAFQQNVKKMEEALKKN